MSAQFSGIVVFVVSFDTEKTARVDRCTNVFVSFIAPTGKEQRRKGRRSLHSVGHLHLLSTTASYSTILDRTAIISLPIYSI